MDIENELDSLQDLIDKYLDAIQHRKTSMIIRRKFVKKQRKSLLFRNSLLHYRATTQKKTKLNCKS